MTSADWTIVVPMKGAVITGAFFAFALALGLVLALLKHWRRLAGLEAWGHLRAWLGRHYVKLIWGFALLISPLWVWMSAASAVTVTVSTVWPTSSVSGGTPTRSAPLTTIPVRRVVLNDEKLTSTVYLSAATFANT